jgi:cyclopropane fatty-acyl-phospholipid synthase-like methyltransferase
MMPEEETTLSGDWNAWNVQGGPKYPHEKVIQFCFRNYRPEARAGVRALDLGCGSGVNTVFLAIEGFEVTGVDPSAPGIANTQKKLEALGLQGTLHVEGAEVLDFPPSSFDLVVCIGVLDAAGPKIARAAIERLASVMSDGARGLFLFASDRDFRIGADHPFNFTLHGYTRPEVEQLFDEAFEKVWIDRYITTYEGGRCEQNDWLVTVQR